MMMNSSGRDSVRDGVARIVTLLDGVDASRPSASADATRNAVLNVTTLITTKYAQLLVDGVPLLPAARRVVSPGQAMYWSVPVHVPAAAAKGAAMGPSNLTLLGYAVDPAAAADGTGTEGLPPVVVNHTVLRPTSSDSPTQLALTVDIPSPSTATGSALVLDGEDAGLVRISLRDTSGILCSTAQGFIVTFTVLSGPARIVGAASGDPSAADGADPPTASATAHAYGGIASAIVQVTVDCTSPNRELMAFIDAEGADSTAPVRVVPPGGGGGGANCPLAPIVIQATATRRARHPREGHEAAVLVSSQVSINVSGDRAHDGPIAVAQRGGLSPNKAWPFFDAFDG